VLEGRGLRGQAMHELRGDPESGDANKKSNARGCCFMRRSIQEKSALRSPSELTLCVAARGLHGSN